jgi:hypothetical protein
MQPVVLDVEGVARFKVNAVVRWMYERLKERGIGLNEIFAAHDPDGSDADDYQQLMQLIGYSVSGYGDLSTSDPEIARAADLLALELKRGG